MEVEVHVYCFSVAANVLLSFFPFMIVIMSLCRYVFHWNAAVEAIYTALHDYFPDDIGDFIKRNLVATVESRGPLQFTSLGLLLFTANGIFEPLEVALNRVWGITTNRSYFKNQLISLGLIFACGSLALLSTSLTAINQEYITKAFGSGAVTAFVSVMIFKAAAVPVVILTLFLIYWLLPNGPVPKKRILAAAIVVAA
ncbi:MAG: YihY/virulence factor BrkB family protein, partial [Bryobacteraceae bacterium]